MNRFYRVFFDADADPTPPAPNPVVQPTTPPKTYTDDELNGILARKTAEAQDKALKDLGLDPKTAKEEMKKWKDAQDAQKTETQKLADALEAEKQGKTTLQQERDIARAELSALKAGVDPKKSDKFVKLMNTYEGETVDKKIEAVLKDFPDFKVDAVPPKFGGKVGNTTQTSEEAIGEEFLKALNG